MFIDTTAYKNVALIFFPSNAIAGSIDGWALTQGIKFVDGRITSSEVFICSKKLLHHWYLSCVIPTTTHQVITRGATYSWPHINSLFAGSNWHPLISVTSYGRHGVSNRWQLDCEVNDLFRLSQENHHTPNNWSRASNQESIPRHDVFMYAGLSLQRSR